MKSFFGTNVVIVAVIILLAFSLMGAKCNSYTSTGFEDFTIRNMSDYTIKVSLVNGNGQFEGERTIESGDEEDYMNIALNWKFSIAAFEDGVAVKIWKWEGLDEIDVEKLFEEGIDDFKVGDPAHGQWVDL